MTQVGRKVAVGAVWMVALRFIDRGIGFLSTLILARLLMPEDFGVVAMAMAVFAFIEIGGQFGFDIALIREREATRAQYDSAWTLQVGYGAFTALALAALAVPAADYFSEPRLTGVLLALGAISVVQGLENIGIVNFRKDFQYGKDFQLMLSKKIVAVTVTMGLAFTFRNYWALLGGIATSRVAGVVLSYALHAYRPRLDWSESKGLLTFSRWIVLRGFLDCLIDRGPDFLIGRHLEAGALGLYRVSREIATLPTTELIFPIMRAVFPGYAAMVHDRQKLAQAFLAVQATIVMLTLPAGVGIVILAGPVVHLLLGPKWLETIPLIQILGLYGALTVFQATNMSIFNVLGVPKWGAALKAAEAALLLPGMYVLFRLGHGTYSVAWAIFGAQALVTPIGMALIGRLLPVGFKERITVSWRPLLGTAAMAVALAALPHALGAKPSAVGAALQLTLAIPVGATVFVASVALLWRLAGMPEGPESRLVALLRARLSKLPASASENPPV